MDRRSFIQLAGVGTAAAALGFIACSPAGEATRQTGENGNPSLVGATAEDVSFSASCDVLVVGSGIAGLSAAMDPSEAGYKVIVADKSTLLGGESYESSGMMNVYGTQLQKDAGLTKTPENYWEERKADLQEKYPDAETPNEELLRSICGLRASWVDRMVNQYHASFQDPKEYLDADVDESIIVPRSGIEGLDDVMNPLRDQLAEQGVEYLLGQALVAFISDGDGLLCGARFHSPESDTFTDVSARAIVLATGSYTTNQTLFSEYLPQLLRTGCYTVLGDGSAMTLAQHAGATTMNLELTPDVLGDVPAVDTWCCFGPVVAVDTRGRRFAREDERYACPNACFQQELGFWWTVFDQQMGKGVQSNSVAKTLEKFAARHVGPFDSIEELADAMGLDAETLEETLKAYEKICEEGTDEEFGRSAHLQPLSAPYHAIKQFPVRFRTMGGLLIDEMCRVLDDSNTPIGNLYAAGSCADIFSQGFLDNAASGLLTGAAVTEMLNEAASE